MIVKWDLGGILYMFAASVIRETECAEDSQRWIMADMHA